MAILSKKKPPSMEVIQNYIAESVELQVFILKFYTNIKTVSLKY